MLSDGKEPLKDSWVEAIRHKLHLRYGEAWVAQSDAFTEEELVVDWAEVLAGMTGEQIKWGLDTWAGDYPPNATQFRNKCQTVDADKKPLNASHHPASEITDKYLLAEKPAQESVAQAEIKNMRKILNKPKTT